MSTHASAEIAFLLVDGYSLMGLTTELAEDGIEGDFEEVTPLGSSFRCQQFTGTTTSRFSQTSFYDDTALSTNAALSAHTDGADRILMFGRSGNTIGQDFTAGVVKQASFKRLIETAKFTKIGAEYMVNERADGLIAAHLVARTTGASTANSDFTAAATAAATGARAYFSLNALALDGATGLTCKVEHSANGSTSWTDLAVFSTSTTAPRAERVAFTGTVKRYMRVTHAWTGGGASPSATFAVGVGLV